ncbi:MAG: DUF1801 domain-containing protein [Gemmatimonadales bacterium]|nr:DUF1801 domain-containing protein [Gemmatimonadales bacterium]
MVSSPAPTVPAYLASLPPERRSVIAKARSLVRKHLPKGYAEVMQYGMIGWIVPAKRYPETYNGQPLCVVALAAQKQKCSLYLMGAYMQPPVMARLVAAYKAAGKKLDMGKSCLRFRDWDDLVPEAVAEVLARCAVDDFIAMHERVHPPKRAKRTYRSRPTHSASHRPVRLITADESLSRKP